MALTGTSLLRVLIVEKHRHLLVLLQLLVEGETSHQLLGFVHLQHRRGPATTNTGNGRGRKRGIRAETQDHIKETPCRMTRTPGEEEELKNRAFGGSRMLVTDTPFQLKEHGLAVLLGDG